MSDEDVAREAARWRWLYITDAEYAALTQPPDRCPTCGSDDTDTFLWPCNKPDSVASWHAEATTTPLAYRVQMDGETVVFAPEDVEVIYDVTARRIDMPSRATTTPKGSTVFQAYRDGRTTTPKEPSGGADG